MARDKDIANMDVSGRVPAPKEESRLASEHAPHVTGQDNKLERYMPKASPKPTLGPRTGGG